MTERLQIVSSGLLAAEMGVYAHVAGRSRQTLTFSVGDVLLGLGVSVLLRHAEIDNVDDIGRLGAWPADEEVVGLDVSIDEVLFVDGLNS